MVKIVEGVSRIFGALVILVISMEFPKWAGVYYSQAKPYAAPVGTSPQALRFNVHWSLACQYGTVFVLLWPFFTGNRGAGNRGAATIPVSIVMGLFTGILLNVCVHYSITKGERLRNWICRILVLCTAIIPGIIFANGVVYIALVWKGQSMNSFLGVIFFFVWFKMACLVHGYLWWSTKKKRLANRYTYSSSLKTEPPSFTDDDDEETQDEEDEENTNKSQQDSNGSVDKETEAQDRANDEEDPSAWSLLRTKLKCCGCARGPSKTRKERIIDITAWALYGFFVCACLYFVIINLGATYQSDIVRKKLPAVYKEVYRDMDEGEVCAFDNRGADSIITTFADKDAAHEAGFLVLHCGACGHCSDWHNLRKEYTTRNYLAKESARCGRKSLFSSYEEVVSCIEEEPIGFQGECALCWATDILCTKANCSFIFLQSTMIGAMGDFAVGPDTITSASCEEAHCEAGQFVPCSGATRRRMNLTSTIARPGAQRCSIVDVNWSTLFPE